MFLVTFCRIIYLGWDFQRSLRLVGAQPLSNLNGIWAPNSLGLIWKSQLLRIFLKTKSEQSVSLRDFWGLGTTNIQSVYLHRCFWNCLQLSFANCTECLLILSGVVVVGNMVCMWKKQNQLLSFPGNVPILVFFKTYNTFLKGLGACGGIFIFMAVNLIISYQVWT